ncbi:hypothetical protein ACN2A0_02500 [Aerococcus viridans]
MSDILTLESPQELLRIKREYILREIAVYGERERENLQQAMQARKARQELEKMLFEYDNTLDTLEELA